MFETNEGFAFLRFRLLIIGIKAAKCLGDESANRKFALLDFDPIL